MLGTEVVLVEGAERLLPQEEAEASAIVEASLAARGVTVITGTGIESVGRSPAGSNSAWPAAPSRSTRYCSQPPHPEYRGLGLDELGASFRRRWPR